MEGRDNTLAECIGIRYTGPLKMDKEVPEGKPMILNTCLLQQLKDVLIDNQNLYEEVKHLNSIFAGLDDRPDVLERETMNRATTSGYSAMQLNPKADVSDVHKDLGLLKLDNLGQTESSRQGHELRSCSDQSDVLQRATMNHAPPPFGKYAMNMIPQVNVDDVRSGVRFLNLDDMGRIRRSREGHEHPLSRTRSIGSRSTGYSNMVSPGVSVGKGKEIKNELGIEKKELDQKLFYQGDYKTELCKNW